MVNIDTCNEKQLSDLIVRNYKDGDIGAALSCCQQLNRRYDDYHYGWYLASYMMSKINNNRDALLAIEKAVSIERLDKYLLQKLQCMVSLGDVGGSKNLCLEMGDASFVSAGQYCDFGATLSELGLYKEALVQFDKAVILDGEVDLFYFNKATVQRYLGDVIGAEESFSVAISKNKSNYEAYSSRSDLKKQTTESNHIEQLKSAINDAIKYEINVADMPQLYYALTKELEDIGENEEAFSVLSSGASRKRQQMQYSVQTDLDIIKSIQNFYTQNLFSKNIQGCDKPDPIFILGMPRTGTTLVERILESHSSVSSCGELNDFAIELMKLVKDSGLNPTSRLDLIDKTTQLDFKKLGEAYLASVQQKRDDSPFFIDKLPFNYLYVGLIHLALPNAKIIHLQRHPMDTCYSVYKQLFKDAYPFSYDLNELGQYYIAYRQLMDHWSAVMPGVMHTVNYEDVVADTEGEARRLLEYCGLPWEEGCLRFYENKAASTTASATQVRQPIYSSSVQRWRCYEKQLEPLRQQLEAAGIVID